MSAPLWWRKLVWRLRALAGRDTLEQTLTEEMRVHVDMEAADLVRTHGLEPAAARRQALLAFGNVERFKEDHRDARGVRWLEELAQDTRYALRSLRRSPGFTLTAVSVLALGLGSSTAIFSAVDAVLVARLPYPDDERLVRIYQSNSPTNLFGLSTVDVRAIEAEQRTMESVGAMRVRGVTLSAGGEPRGQLIAVPNAAMLRTLGLTVAAGRPFARSDEDSAAAPVAIVTHDFAVKELGGVNAALDRSLTLDGVSFAVVGVLPARTTEIAGFRVPVWVPLKMPTPTRRGPFGIRVIGRLKPGVTLDAARADLAGVSERLFPLWESSFQDRSVKFVPYDLRQTMLGQAPETMRLFMLAVGLVLLIAVANVASLALVRATARSRETSLRTALGASRTRVARLLVTEGIILAGIGAGAGVLLAQFLLKGVAVFGLAIPRLSQATIDGRAFGFAALLALATGVLVALHPVLSLRRGVRSAIQGGERDVGAKRGTHRARGILVATQFALALPVLAASALLLNSFLRLGRVNPGFDPAHLLYVHVTLPRQSYPDPAAAATYWNRALAMVSALPSVEAAGTNQSLPPEEPPDVNNWVLVDQENDPRGAQDVSPWNPVTPSFFEALQIPLLEGRMFQPTDTGAAPVLIVSRAWVRQFSPNRPAIGRQLQGGGCTDCTPYTIVGVVDDVKYLGLGGSAQAVYEPTEQYPATDTYLLVRTAGPPGPMIERVREVLRSLDAGLALDDAGTMATRLSDSVAPERHRTALIGGFGVTALLLAAVGVFGMLSYLVATRRREIGVRMALGARRAEVLALIVRRGMGWAAGGAALGLVAALATGRWLQSSLYEIAPGDPLTLIGVTGLLLVVALLASWLPARRAASVPPMSAIREE
jgi:predicted permease